MPSQPRQRDCHPTPRRISSIHDSPSMMPLADALRTEGTEAIDHLDLPAKVAHAIGWLLNDRQAASGAGRARSWGRTWPDRRVMNEGARSGPRRSRAPAPSPTT